MCGTVGCASSPHVQAVGPTEPSQALAIRVGPQEFPKRTHALLLSAEHDQAQKLELAGVVQYQLARAEQLFEKGFDREGEDMVTGALLLLRHDDEVLSATRGRGARSRLIFRGLLTWF